MLTTEEILTLAEQQRAKAEQPIDLDAVAMQQMRQAAAESTWMPAEYSGSDWISDVCRWLRDGPPQAGPKCGCRACLSPAELMTTFVVCPKCGNKRCPKADDHRYACTGSNAPGQTPQAEPKRAHGIGGSDE